MSELQEVTATEDYCWETDDTASDTSEVGVAEESVEDVATVPDQSVEEAQTLPLIEEQLYSDCLFQGPTELSYWTYIALENSQKWYTSIANVFVRLWLLKNVCVFYKFFFTNVNA